MVNGTQVATAIGSKMKVVDAVAGNPQAGKLNYVEIEGTLVGCLVVGGGSADLDGFSVNLA